MLLTTERNSNDYPRSIDETPKFVDNPNSGTAPIEHYIRRLVTYLARLQSVTQNSEKGLNLKVYVKLDTKQWLRMYSRIYHACEIATCMHLPDPIMLTAAAMIRSNDDLAVDPDPERSNNALSHPKCANRDGPWRQTGWSSSSCSDHDTRYGL